MANSYMTVETTNLIGCSCYSLQDDANDIQNGAIVGKGDLVDGEMSVYKAIADVKDGMYLVANPAWSYDESATAQNEENFVNVKGVPFRVYELKKDKKFKIGNLPADTTFEKGDYVKYESGKYAKDETKKSGLKVVAVEEIGFPYCVGSYGVKVTGDSTNEYGYAIDTRNTKYTIEVVPVAAE